MKRHKIPQLGLPRKKKRQSQVLPVCPICMETFHVLVASLDCCCHRYCRECIHKWLDTGEMSCPNCRKTIGAVHFTSDDGDVATSRNLQVPSSAASELASSHETEILIDEILTQSEQTTQDAPNQGMSTRPVAQTDASRRKSNSLIIGILPRGYRAYGRDGGCDIFTSEPSSVSRIFLSGNGASMRLGYYFFSIMNGVLVTRRSLKAGYPRIRRHII